MPAIWRSSDAEKTWTTTCPGGRTEQVNAVVVDPTSPRTLYAGMASGSVFRSTDAGLGRTWSQGGGEGLPYDEINEPILALALDPPSTLYAGGLHGFFKSTDAGESGDRVGNEKWWVNTITVHPTRPGTVYVGVTDNRFFDPDSALDGGFIKTSDGFDSWQMIDVEPAADAGGCLWAAFPSFCWACSAWRSKAASGSPRSTGQLQSLCWRRRAR